MHTPFQLTSHSPLESSPTLAAHLQLRADKLDQLFDRMISCHVVVGLAAHRHEHDNHFMISTHVGLPGHELLVNHVPNDDHKPTAALETHRPRVRRGRTALKLKSMVDAGELSIVLRDGRMVLQLPSDVLFPSGQADVRPHSQTAIKQIANVLKTVPNRAFQVAGHADNLPIDKDRAKNRRIEITVQPNIDEMIWIPGTK